MHRHGPVFQIDRRLYSECCRCGVDLVRGRKRWHPPRPDEVPAGWKPRTRQARRGLRRALL